MPTPLRNLLTLRFSLRAMLVGVTVVCVLIGWRANRLIEQKRARDSLTSNHYALLIRKPGSTATELLPVQSFWKVERIEFLFIQGPSTAQYIDFPDLWADLSRLSPLGSINFFQADFPVRRKHGATGGLMDITDVEFSFCSFRGDSFSFAVEQLHRLRSLSIDHCTMDLAKLECLNSCRDLESLRVIQHSIPPNVIASIKAGRLKRLDLVVVGGDQRIELSESDVETIAKLEHLESLRIASVFGAGFPVSALQQLKQCKNLKDLTIHLEPLNPR